MFGRGWALITGASSGFGVEFAWILAAQGCNLILVARRKAKMEALAELIKQQYRITIHVLAADLALPETPTSLFQSVQDLLSPSGAYVSVLINNAGVGHYGDFHK